MHSKLQNLQRVTDNTYKRRMIHISKKGKKTNFDEEGSESLLYKVKETKQLGYCR